MLVSLNWLKKFVDIDVSAQQLKVLIGSRLVEVENIVDIGQKYKDVVIVKVIESSKMEGSDHLSVIKIDDNGVVSDIERDEKDLVQVVCGAPNMRAGITVAWLPPKSVVPDTYGTADPFVLDARKLRGVMSNGMIASAKELDISDDNEGILEIDESVGAGVSFAKQYELDDYLFDIENKSLTSRPDCFGIIGFAREVSAILGKKFTNPDWFLNTNIQDVGQSRDTPINVTIEDETLSSRYLAVVMDGISVLKQSTLIIQTYLSRMGVRPINAIVDVTNYLMLLTGQPLHAFDYDKLVNLCGEVINIHVRLGKEGEKLELLDGKTIELSTEDIVISAGKNAIALAGAMGGLNTTIDENTKRIVIESASFDLYRLRATQMRHGIFSEAITRFTKGQTAGLTAPVIGQATQMISELTGAKCASPIAEDYPVVQLPIKIDLDVSKINTVLGSNFEKDTVQKVLENVGFSITHKISGLMTTTVPYFRSDVHILEDIIEEVGRIAGFDNIKPTLPVRECIGVKPDDFDIFRSNLRRTLAKAGANEVLSYSFVNADNIKKAGQDLTNSYRIINSISPDLQYYRQSLSPNLLGFAYSNVKQGYDNFALFEINKVHQKDIGLNDESVPNEIESLALVITNKNPGSGAAYYRAKRLLDMLSKTAAVDLVYETIEEGCNDPSAVIFDPNRSAKVINKLTNAIVGYVGEYKKSVINGFKIPEYSSGFEINSRTLFVPTNKIISSYSHMSKYPGTERDMCFKVADDICYNQVNDAIYRVLSKTNYKTEVLPVDIYKQLETTTKNITVRVKITAFDHTLTRDEIAEVIDNVCKSVISATNAVIV